MYAMHITRYTPGYLKPSTHEGAVLLIAIITGAASGERSQRTAGA